MKKFEKYDPKTHFTDEPIIDENPSFLRFDEKKNVVVIDFVEFHEFLESHGFYKLEGTKGYSILRIKQNICKLYEAHQLKNFVESQFSDYRFVDYLINRQSAIFPPGKLDFLKPFESEFINDTENTKTLYFLNGILRVTENGINGLESYHSLQNPIWESQIIKRNFVKVDINELDNGEFYKLLENVTGKDDDRFLSLLSAIGYMLHSYSDPANPRAIVFYDEQIPEYGDELNGGTGKSLVGTALSKFNNSTIMLNGASDITASRFGFQRLNQDTRIIIINELPDDFPFKNLFSHLSDGFIVEKKREHQFVIKNVKVLITTNSIIEGEGASFERRKFEIEFAPHYSATHTPLDEFGHMLFYDWDEKEWSLFDNLMLQCIEIYFQSGLIPYQRINVQYRKMMKHIPEELFFFFEGLQFDLSYHKSLMLERFNDKYRRFPVSPNKFTRSLKAYCRGMNCDLFIKPGPGNRNHTVTIKERKKTNNKPPK